MSKPVDFGFKRSKVRGIGSRFRNFGEILANNNKTDYYFLTEITLIILSGNISHDIER